MCPILAPFRSDWHVEKHFDQRLEWLGTRLEREEAPAAAVRKGARPLRRVLDAIGPGLALERRQHARLRKRGLADPRIAEQHREPVPRRSERREPVDCFPLPAEGV